MKNIILLKKYEITVFLGVCFSSEVPHLQKYIKILKIVLYSMFLRFAVMFFTFLK